MRTNPWPICKPSPLAGRRAAKAWCAGTAILVALLGPCANVVAEPGAIFRLPDVEQAVASDDSVYFAAGAATLDEEANPVLQRHVAKLRGTPGLQVTIVAHTDDLGSASLELARGQLQLDAVRRYLDSANISPTRVRALNHGSENSPASACDDDECRRSRRRVDFLFHR